MKLNNLAKIASFVLVAPCIFSVNAQGESEGVLLNTQVETAFAGNNLRLGFGHGGEGGTNTGGNGGNGGDAGDAGGGSGGDTGGGDEDSPLDPSVPVLTGPDGLPPDHPVFDPDNETHTLTWGCSDVIKTPSGLDGAWLPFFTDQTADFEQTRYVELSEYCMTQLVLVDKDTGDEYYLGEPEKDTTILGNEYESRMVTVIQGVEEESVPSGEWTPKIEDQKYQFEQIRSLSGEMTVRRYTAYIDGEIVGERSDQGDSGVETESRIVYYDEKLSGIEGGSLDLSTLEFITELFPNGTLYSDNYGQYPRKGDDTDYYAFGLESSSPRNRENIVGARFDMKGENLKGITSGYYYTGFPDLDFVLGNNYGTVLKEVEGSEYKDEVIVSVEFDVTSSSSEPLACGPNCEDVYNYTDVSFTYKDTKIGYKSVPLTIINKSYFDRVISEINAVMWVNLYE
ncbi:hypothetical protein L1267_18930 [Pseudoalteromonas sp. OFAV1]|uniref:hypothetical protein n=1 Tax=Pseudoalteromonas sp. OFAV1 TaxID=2908892 RepID=UPI001F3653A3|nr:hypothetical protein [Pseudoalteromonas sp. OFAV1]MCF2902448.1 hypothetical protein [Pseudoalteromonas sp. OFAV1]